MKPWNGWSINLRSGQMATSTDNVYWQNSLVSPEDRQKLLGQRGAVLWFTGLSGSGKSTLARALETTLIQSGSLSYVLDGDNVRHGLNAGLGFSEEDRAENLRRVAEVAQLFADAGLICLVSFISPTRHSRAVARSIVGETRFAEIHIAADLDTCETRDVKGLYAKARRGEIPDFTGISAPYEPPEKPSLVIDSSRHTIDECVAELQKFVIERFLIKPT